MKLENEGKTNLMIDGSEVECVLLKHGPPAAMQVEFERNREIYEAFAQQFENSVSVPHLQVQSGPIAEVGHQQQYYQLQVQGLWLELLVFLSL